MSESIAIDLKRAAVFLGNELDHGRAAEKLNITSAEFAKTNIFVRSATVLPDLPNKSRYPISHCCS